MAIAQTIATKRYDETIVVDVPIERCPADRNQRAGQNDPADQHRDLNRRAAGDLFDARASETGHVPVGAGQMPLHLHEPRLGEVYLRWLAEFDELVEIRERSRHTRVAYEKAGRLGLLTWFSPRPMGALTTREVVQMQAAIAKDRGPAIANQCIYVIRLVYRWAAERGIWDCPCPAGGVRKLTQRNRRMPLAPDAGQRVAAICWDAFLRPSPSKIVSDVHGAYFLTALGTGLRRSELTHLRRNEYDVRRRVVTITQHKTSRTRGPKTLPCNDPTCTILDAVIARDWHPVWFFPSPRSQRGHLEDPDRAWQRLKQAADVPEATRIHDIRHGFAESAYARCRDLKMVQSLMGHSSLATTSHYVGTPQPTTTRPTSNLAAMDFMGPLPVLGEEGDDV